MKGPESFSGLDFEKFLFQVNDVIYWLLVCLLVQKSIDVAHDTFGGAGEHEWSHGLTDISEMSLLKATSILLRRN